MSKVYCMSSSQNHVAQVIVTGTLFHAVKQLERSWDLLNVESLLHVMSASKSELFIVTCPVKLQPLLLVVTWLAYNFGFFFCLCHSKCFVERFFLQTVLQKKPLDKTF